VRTWNLVFNLLTLTQEYYNILVYPCFVSVECCQFRHGNKVTSLHWKKNTYPNTAEVIFKIFEVELKVDTLTFILYLSNLTTVDMKLLIFFILSLDNYSISHLTPITLVFFFHSFYSLLFSFTFFMWLWIADLWIWKKNLRKAWSQIWIGICQN
jgi:hypothetical protein